NIWAERADGRPQILDEGCHVALSVGLRSNLHEGRTRTLLQPRKVYHPRGILPEVVVLGIPDHADDLDVLGSGMPPGESFSHRVGAAKVVACHRLIDDRNPGRSAPVCVRERTAGDERDAQCAEVLSADRLDTNALVFIFVRY